MKKSIILPLLGMLAIEASHGAAGIFDELVWVTSVSPFSVGTSTFMEIDDNNANLFGAAEFQGSNLGTFNNTATLFLTGQQKSFKNSGTDVTGHTLHWSLNGGVTSTPLSYGFQANLGSSGDQRWGNDVSGVMTSNILTGLANGVYTLSIWSTINTNSVNAAPVIFNNRGGQNYNATFTVIPEPSSAVLLGALGTMALLRRRK
ncbi:MAG: PEP-CTERM sorting domain-containing protein [Verrucomicrobia bacterium]|nr:MAG: PEP-CTERM sorting domain-containing protein [Verrucomicrobiota bacterium]